ncbi:putative peptidoglycan muropeptide transporter SLC46 [Brevipalpus obovatus]|uniref:putative peptidoglycan muropeptide transporter SLC46 n=1 Tax=Brevipalpus obovatus TaxID=246614 RepID=UPI003D9E1C6A
MPPNQQNDCRKNVDNTTHKSFSYLKVISLDIFCFIVCFTFGFSDISLNQIVQDKICLNDLHLSRDVCHNIQDQKDYLPQAIDIYTHVTRWKSYVNFIGYFPGILVTIFLGKWLDRYPNMMKYVLAAQPLGNLVCCLIVLHQLFYFKIDYMILLVSNVPKVLNGGIAAFLCCVFSIVTTTSPSSHRMIRFGMIEFSIQGGVLAGTLLGGPVLALKPWFGIGLQNYAGVFVLTSIINLVAIIWGLILIDTGKPFKSQINETTGRVVINQNSTEEPSTNRKKWTQMFRELFDTSNVIEMLRTCAKKRPQHKHLHLRLYFLSIGIYIFCVLGETTVAYQFAQLVYRWSAVYYSTARAIALILPTFMGIFWPYILQKWFHLGDAACGILGVVSAMLSFIIKGGILKPYAFFLSSVIGAFASVFLPCLRSMISKSVNSDEIGQVFTLLGCIEATTPMLDGFYYSFIFSNTANVYPGMVYHATIGIFLIPYLSILWIDLDMRREKRLQLEKQGEDIISG